MVPQSVGWWPVTGTMQQAPGAVGGLQPPHPLTSCPPQLFDPLQLPETSPLWDLDTVLLSPHASWRTQHHSLWLQGFVTNAERFRSGQPLSNVCDKTTGY